MDARLAVLIQYWNMAFIHANTSIKMETTETTKYIKLWAMVEDNIFAWIRKDNGNIYLTGSGLRPDLSSVMANIHKDEPFQYINKHARLRRSIPQSVARFR